MDPVREPNPFSPNSTNVFLLTFFFKKISKMRSLMLKKKYSPEFVMFVDNYFLMIGK